MGRYTSRISVLLFAAVGLLCASCGSSFVTTIVPITRSQQRNSCDAAAVVDAGGQRLRWAGRAGAAVDGEVRRRRTGSGVVCRMMAGALDETKGVTVKLADYKNGAITVKVPKMDVSEAQIETALQDSKKPYSLVPVRFVEEGGTKMGHTVIMNWEAKVNGAPVPGSKKENFELELTEDQPEPWKTFAVKLAVGMGQMETKVFPAMFPDDFEVEGLRGKNGLVQAVVKKIARKEDKPVETRSDDELRELLRAKGAQMIQARVDQMVGDGVKKTLLETCDVDADKVLNAVSWAKFGEKSSSEFKWNCIREKIAAVEGIEPREVVDLLRKEANVEVVEKK